MQKELKTISLMIKCRKLLEEGLTYEELRYMLSYDKNVYAEKKAAARLLDGSDKMSDITAIELHEKEEKECVITSREEYGAYKEALDLAQESIRYEEEQDCKLALKNTN